MQQPRSRTCSIVWLEADEGALFRYLEEAGLSSRQAPPPSRMEVHGPFLPRSRRRFAPLWDRWERQRLRDALAWALALLATGAILGIAAYRALLPNFVCR